MKNLCVRDDSLASYIVHAHHNITMRPSDCLSSHRIVQLIILSKDAVVNSHDHFGHRMDWID